MTSDNTPATPCAQALLYLNDRVEQMKLQEDHRIAGSFSDADAVTVPPAPAPAPPAPPQDSDAKYDSSSSSIFQTPSSNRKLFFVVTPPRIEKKVEQDDYSCLHEHLPASPLPPQAEPHGRKRNRGGTIQLQPPPPPRSPPMFPSSLESHCAHRSIDENSTNKNVFGRHIPIHSPIAGIVGTMNVEFMAQLLGNEETPAVASLSFPHLSQGGILEHHDSFLARHSFPDLDDQEEAQQQNSTISQQPGSGRGLVSCTQALKMRRRCQREDYDGLLQVEKELLLL